MFDCRTDVRLSEDYTFSFHLFLPKSEPDCSYGRTAKIFAMKHHLFCLSVALLSAIIVLAQDTHYWTEQYVRRSEQMVCAVVCGTKDNA